MTTMRGRHRIPEEKLEEDGQVAGGSFDLSTGCPAGYVSFLSVVHLLSFLTEGIPPWPIRRGRGGPAPAIHFAASERMGELISDISTKKGPRAAREAGVTVRLPLPGQRGPLCCAPLSAPREERNTLS
ncbi:hypothetical protein KM043_008586 [Ampulex compressa]|nr:hypothetical protein KM043_008586 [Ampulex compressa]